MSEGLSKLIRESCRTGDLDVLLNVKYNYPNVATDLVKGSADADDELPFLHVACQNGHLSITRHLIYAGADVNQSKLSQTPINIACQKGHAELVDYLISNGAVIDPMESDFENSPIYLACCNGHTSIVESLVSKEPMILRRSGQLLLYIAAYEGHLDIVKFFIQRRVNINHTGTIVNEEGVAVESLGALHGACKGKKANTVQYLIENGALVTESIVDEFGEDVLKTVLFRYTKDANVKRKTTFSFEHDPNVNRFSVNWGHKNLHALHKAWFVDYSLNLVRIDLANNSLHELPEELLNTLPLLEELDVSNNNLVSLPEISNLSFMSLEKLFAQRNNLTWVSSSLFQLKTLNKLNLSHNKLTMLGEEDTDLGSQGWMRCTSLKVLKVTHNLLESLPFGIQSASSLVKLFLSNNKLKEFPMPWKCPLETLDLSYNSFTSFVCSVDMVWANSLLYLNLSHNHLDAISGNVCQLNALQELNVSHNKIRRLPQDRYWCCTNLHKLDLSYNKLTAKYQGDGTGFTLRQRLFKTPSQEEYQEASTDCEFPVDLFAPTLETLLLNDNGLLVVPPSVCRLTNLNELDLSNNPDLRTLPPQLGNLRDCWQLRLNKLTLTELPKHVRPGTIGVRSKDTLAFLRATLRKSVPYYRMKLMVVGIQGYGKTTLLAALKGQPLPSNLSTVGIVVDEWSVQISTSLLSRIGITSGIGPTITLSTWDLAGQSVYYAAHQMFLTPSTLYLAVWNATLGEEGVENLRSWLLNIKARAPYSDVIIIGTHLDRIPRASRESRVKELNHMIMKRYNTKGFPKIVGYTVVSAVTGEGITELKELIYKKAINSKEQGQLVIGKQVPLSYIQLQDAIRHEAERRREARKPPILLEEEMLALAAGNKDNDIHDHEELALATRFLHDNGVLLHYNDQLRGLNTLYFIDPAWVCDLIASIVTVREKNGYVRDGIMLTSNVRMVLRDPRFPPNFIPQYLQLMERFEIALTLDDFQILIPSMLPHEAPGIKMNELYRLFQRTSPDSTPHSSATLPTRKQSKESSEMDAKAKASTLGVPGRRQPRGTHDKDGSSFDQKELDLDDDSHDSIQRNYQMAYVPSGLWSRLITRLLVSLQRWRQTEGIDESRLSVIYWRKGIGVMYEEGHFVVKSYREMVPLSSGRRFEELEGITVQVWSNVKDFSVMGFIVDQIDALISEWYPGLDDTDNFGYPLVRRLIPCPKCTTDIRKRPPSLRRSCSMEFPSQRLQRPFNFTLPTCAAAALMFSTISCPYHPDSVVCLDELVPDLMMTDLPRHLLVERCDFSYRDDAASRLGGGGAGEVFRGELRNSFVAVKTFHSTRASGLLFDSGIGERSGARDWSAASSSLRPRSEGTSMRRAGLHRFEVDLDDENVENELEKTKVVRAFWDLRQEVAVLCHLQHPCVVRLLGVCLRPLCFLLELAPHGSLASVMEDITLGRRETEKEHVGAKSIKYETKQTPLGRGLTYKIAYQVASALWYLHDSDIIYRDLKTDNVLVWSLHDTDLVNVKLSDYGISCFATPQGVAGDEGTPGYQAPEILPGIGYDEKVDIFSYAIFLYELMSGTRPFRNYRSAVDIKRDIRRNIRPSLEEQEIDSQLPRLEQLMRWGWRELPEQRPTAETLLHEMEDPAFLCQFRIMPSPEEGGVLEKITAVYGLAQSGSGNPGLGAVTPGSSPNFVLVWSREREQRNFSMLNCDTGVFYRQEESCPGHRVLCMARVGTRTWLGTEGQTIEVFGKRSWRLPSTLCSFIVKAPVLALLTEEHPLQAQAEPQTRPQVKKVYASLANGTLVVFTHISASTACQLHSDVTLSYTDVSDDVIKKEMSEWRDIQVINLGQNRNPVKCMVLVNDSRELWASCGNKILIVSTQTLAVIEEITVYSSLRAHIRKMVVSGDKVWSIDRRSTKILEWDVKSYQLSRVFDVDLEHPIGKIVCKPFENSLDQDIGEEEAAIPTIPRMRRPEHVSVNPPSYGEATQTVDASTSPGTKVLVDRALGGGRVSRSGALKRRSACGPYRPDPQEDRGDLRIEGHTDSDRIEKTYNAKILIPGGSDETDAERNEKSNSDGDLMGTSRENDDTDTKRTDAERGEKGNSDGDLMGTSVDSGFAAEDLGACLTKQDDEDQDRIGSVEEGASIADETESNKETKEKHREDEVGVSNKESTQSGEGDGQSAGNGCVIADLAEENVASGDINWTVEKSLKTNNINSNDEEFGSNGANIESADSRKDKRVPGEESLELRSDKNANDPKANTAETEEENGNSEFELVDRERLIVEHARLRSEAKRAAIEAGDASMASLKAKPRTTQRGPSLMRSWKRSKRQPMTSLDRGSRDQIDSPKKRGQRPRLQVRMGSMNKVMTVQMVGGVLWVGRGRGDILVINVDPDAKECEYGEVLAQLEIDNNMDYSNGQMDEIIITGNDKVVCLRRLEPMRTRKLASLDTPQYSPYNADPSTERYQVIVLEAWGRSEFQAFKTYLDQFNSLME
ncbi:leucine-rich repeat serine/threonine-protein kinase 1 isoform X2 [Nematostella vectensis]|uniref:leucine-rich repeat serine/threonine-protein kinase 1 isoform X2 n=1 Tax=Nematostella vectensis TaxID=45351 RepID=UPI00207731A3|nr:leucine-rich repeat serine/threonine-protein kinase 1 isoform X2 [Nematostella vectensis]